MAAFQNFRTALRGFNREDVVHYIEYINNKHTSQINQLTNEMQAMQEELTALRGKPSQDEALAQAQAQCAALEQEVAELKAQLEQAQDACQNSELEAYRRAERTERMANERVALLYQQANGALAEATVRADEAAARIGEAAARVSGELSELQAALDSGKAAMADAASALGAIAPATPEE